MFNTIATSMSLKLCFVLFCLRIFFFSVICLSKLIGISLLVVEVSTHSVNTQLLLKYA